MVGWAMFYAHPHNGHPKLAVKSLGKLEALTRALEGSVAQIDLVVAHIDWDMFPFATYVSKSSDELSNNMSFWNLVESDLSIRQRNDGVF